MNLALVAGPQEQIDAARYFTSASDRPQTSRAVTLYHRAGLLSKVQQSRIYVARLMWLDLLMPH